MFLFIFKNYCVVVLRIDYEKGVKIKNRNLVEGFCNNLNEK